MTGRKTASVHSGSRAQNTRGTRAAPTENPTAATEGNLSNPDLGNPSLPDVRTQQSFAYGSTKTPALPRQLEVDPSMGLSEMIDTLDDGLRQAQDRELARVDVEDPTHPVPERRQTRSMSASVRSSISPAPGPVSRRASSRNATTRSRAGPRRAVSRQTTPEEQLLETLREVSEETEGVKREEDPSVSVLHDTPSFNGSASVSWTTERAIHGILPRETNAGTRPNYYLHDPYGSRPSSSQEPSGLRLPPTRRPIFEEAFRANPPLPGPIDVPNVSTSAAARRTLPPVPAFNQLRNKSASKSSASSAFSASIHTPGSSTHSSPVLVAATPAGVRVTSKQRLSGIAKTPSALLVTIGLILMTVLTYFCRDHACMFPQSLQNTMSHYLCSPASTFATDNSTSMYSEAFHKLSSRLDQRLSDMAKEVAILKNEWNRRLPHLKEALSGSPAAAINPLKPPKVNYASIGMGAVVDPYLTSPTMATSAGLVSRIGQYLAKVPRGSPPVAALQPWDGVGECWCAATRSNASQLTILLGRAIVPEEVVIEHIPKGATLDPGSAPREMELWVQYMARPPTAAAAYPQGSGSSNPSPPPSSASSPHAPSPFPPSSAPSQPLPPPPATPHLRNPPFSHLRPSYYPHHLLPSWLRDAILTTLRQVYPNEPTTAYSDDALLGPSFFRVGRWQYNIHGGHHIQRFDLDAVIDMPAVRVEKVVFRVKSNWGAAHTCLYRIYRRALGVE
ncbi:predicted protein [Histoplasma mississippiense (nom. inval.)]|uniref:predicted protein n=1 Tax=Ajellomyces capsulatus (strain NAm1 / WU24) TaxID=2059318 RepID=UPI000157B5E6|nr:predicted protein [Histoplasma mississippiense (nom. inval.)]EDN02423.1 predicted protein [Histoplasma mississippiense (nom. inval.)]